MGFKEFFRFTRGKLLFAFVLTFIALVSLLIGIEVLSGTELRYIIPMIINGLILMVVSFPGLLLVAKVFRPLGFFLPYPGEGGIIGIIGYVLVLAIDFVFWYLIACVFSWIFSKFRKNKET